MRAGTDTLVTEWVHPEPTQHPNLTRLSINESACAGLLLRSLRRGGFGRTLPGCCLASSGSATGPGRTDTQTAVWISRQNAELRRGLQLIYESEVEAGDEQAPWGREGGAVNSAAKAAARRGQRGGGGVECRTNKQGGGREGQIGRNDSEFPPGPARRHR